MIFTSSVFSQKEITLDELLATSLKNNFDIELANLNNESSAKQNNLGMAGFLPRIYLSASQQFSNSNRNNPTSFVNGKITNNSFSPSIGFEQVLFNGFQAHINKENFDLLQEMSNNNIDLVIMNNLKAIYLNYFKIQAQYELIDYQKQILQLSIDLYDYNKKKWDIGIVTTQELNTYEGFVLEDSLNLLILNNQIILLESNLSKICNLNELTVRPETLSKKTFSFDITALSDSLKSHPNIKSLYLNEQLKTNELRKSKTSLYPTITLNAGYDYNRSNTRLENVDPFTGTTNDYYLGFSLAYNLFNGNKVRTGTKIAQLNSVIQTVETKKMEQSLNIDLQTYVKSYEQYEQQWLLSKKLLKVTANTLDYWQTKQKAGLLTSIQLREYQKSHLLNKRNELTQWLQLYENSIEIQSLTNQLVY